MPVHFRWATEAEEQPVKSAGSKRALVQGQGPSKRAKAQGTAAHTDDFDGLTAGLDGFFGKKQGHRGMHDNAKPTRGVLKKVMPMHLPGLELKTFDELCSTTGQTYCKSCIHISAFTVSLTQVIDLPVSVNPQIAQPGCQRW